MHIRGIHVNFNNPIDGACPLYSIEIYYHNGPVEREMMSRSEIEEKYENFLLNKIQSVDVRTDSPYKIYPPKFDVCITYNDGQIERAKLFGDEIVKKYKAYLSYANYEALTGSSPSKEMFVSTNQASPLLFRNAPRTPLVSAEPEIKSQVSWDILKKS